MNLTVKILKEAYHNRRLVLISNIRRFTDVFQNENQAPFLCDEILSPTIHYVAFNLSETKSKHPVGAGSKTRLIPSGP